MVGSTVSDVEQGDAANSTNNHSRVPRRHDYWNWITKGLLIFFGTLTCITLVLEIYVVVFVDHNHSGPGGAGAILLYTSFGSTKYLLFVSSWATLTLVFLVCRQYDTLVTACVELDFELDASIAHLLLWLLLFIGAIVHGVWIGKTVYCLHLPGYTDCRSLATKQYAIAVATEVLTVLQLLVWTYATIRTWTTTMNGYFKHRVDRMNRIPAS